MDATILPLVATADDKSAEWGAAGLSFLARDMLGCFRTQLSDAPLRHHS